MSEKSCAQCGGVIVGVGKRWCSWECYRAHRASKARPVIERIRKRLGAPNARGCVPWLGATTRGYGVLNVKKRAVLVPRLLWTELRSPIPKGMVVRHRCDNPICCNIDHLLLGTMKDNTNDMMARGRHGVVVGDENGRAKLSEGDVRQLRALYRAGVGTPTLADRFGICQRQAWMIATKRSWKHVA